MHAPWAGWRWMSVGGLLPSDSLHTGLWDKLRFTAFVLLALVACVWMGPASAQNPNAVSVKLVSTSPAKFSGAGQTLTFKVELYSGNIEVNGLTFTSGNPGGVTPSCPSVSVATPMAIQTTANCTFTYVTTSTDVALGSISALQRWRVTRGTGASRNGTSNTLLVPYALPVVSINDVSAAEGNAGTTNFTFTVSLDAPAGQTSTVNYATADGTALAGSDYSAASGTVSFAPGESSKTITVSVLGDAVVEPNETFTITLSAPSNLVLGDASGTGTINNDDVMAPIVSAISPSAGPTTGGTVVTVSGSNFTGATSVTFGGAAASSYTVNSATSITATAPANSAGTVDVRVTTAGGTSATSATDQYTYIEAPTVTAVSPKSGPTAGGTTVVITGTGFTGATAVTFGATASTSFTVNTATQITATSPAHAPGTVDVRVTTAGGTSATSATDQYTYIAAPMVTAVSPSSGPTAGGTTVVITGANFSAATAVTFGGTPAIGYTIDANTQITATSPAGSAGTVDVRVTTPGGTSATSQASQYNYLAAPTVSDVLPRIGQVDTQVQITGTGFTNARVVRFGSAVATAYTIISDTQISATAPANADGIVNITVTTPGGTSNGSEPSSKFTYDTTSPQVVSVTRMDPSPSNATSVQFLVTFSEALKTVSMTDFQLTTTGTVRGNVDQVTPGTGNSYTVTVSGISGDGTLRLDVNNTGGLADLAGLPLAVGFSSGEVYTFDHTAPRVVSVRVPTDGAYTAGDTLTFQVDFDDAVEVDSAGGAPRITLDVGAIQRTASYVSGAGGAVLTFSYTVQAGDTDPDGITITGLQLNGGTIRDAAGNDALLALNNLPDTSAIIVLQPPTVDAVSVTMPAGSSMVIPLAITGSWSSVAVMTGPVNGTAVVGNQTSITYTPMRTFAGTDSFTYTATNGAGTSTEALVSITVTPPAITLTPADLPEATAGASYTTQLGASGGTDPYTYSITSGTLPSGVLLSPEGQMSGTPVAAGTFTFTVTATDSVSFSGEKIYTLMVNAPAITIPTVALPAGNVGEAYASTTLSAQGGTSPYSYAVAAGALPDGMSLSAGGEISGTPSVAGTFNFTVAATDSTVGNGAPYTGMQGYSVTIGQATQAITFGAQTNQTYASSGTFALNPEATASSGLPVSYSTQTAGVCSISGTTVTMLASGTCTIAADQAGDANYQAAAQVTQSIVIGQATQAITGFAANPATPTYTPNGTFSVSAMGGASSNPVVFASTSAGVCTVSGSTVTMVSAGTCSLTANQAGNANYSAAPQVTLVVTIGKAAPVVSWTSNINKVYGEAAFDLPLPTSTSSGAFAFTSSNAQVATISGRTVTITGAGTTTLTATQAATANYAAGTISITLTVGDRPDPTKDTAVVGGLQAQVDASVRFVQVQQDNIRGRLQQLRSGGNASSNNVSLSVQGSWNQPGLSLNAGQAGATPQMAKGWGFWSAGSVIVGERDARGVSQGFDFRSDGITFGVDRLVGQQMVFGAAVGLGWNDSDLDDDRSSMDARQQSVALYGLWRSDAWFLEGSLGWGQLDFDLVRWSSTAHALATAGRDGDQLYGTFGLGYQHRTQTMNLTGYGRLDASRTTLDGYRETGLGIYDLQYARQKIENSTAALGLEGRHSFKTESAMLRPFWMVEWRQALQNQSAAGINYVVLPRGSDYMLALRSYNEDVAALGAGLDVGFDNGWTLTFQFRREQARDVFANSFGLRLSWGQAPLLTAEQLKVLDEQDPSWMSTGRGPLRP